MKSRIFLPFLALAGVILLVGLACGTTPTATPTQPPPIQIQPTQPPPVQIQPTQEPPTEVPTEAPAEAPDYFTEEFDDLIPNWTYDVKHGDATQLDIHTDNGVLVFNITGEDLYAYLMYDPYIYKNVRIDVFADNRGKNTNDVVLVCRYSEEGWYEFNISNGGLWTVWVNDKLTGGGYLSLNSGGSTAIRSGRDTNEYTAICNGNTLSLYINGREITSFTEKKYNLRDGQVGIGVSSYSVLPIIVEFDWVTISEP